MSEVNLSHPTPGRLIAYGLGRLAEADAAEVRAHLESCPTCRSLLDVGKPDTTPPAKTADDLAGQARPPAPNANETPTQVPPSPPPAGGADLPGLADHPRYRILQLLGAGGMGAVYKAEHRLMERVVALKVINRALVDSPTAVERFRLEVKAAARLSHPNIVTAYDAEQVEDVHFLVMEFVEGVSLAGVVERRGPLPVVHTCEYVRQAALGLQHAYEKGMVHRDIKPHNLMIAPKGRLKILDFGLARFVSERGTGSGLTAQGVVMGTPDYIAPEQADDARNADTRADIYSLGCTLYFMLTGQAPFPKGSPLQKILAHFEQQPLAVTAFRSDVPDELLEILGRMTAKRPSERFQTPIDVARALLPLVKGTPPADPDPRPASPKDEPKSALPFAPKPPPTSKPQPSRSATGLRGTVSKKAKPRRGPVRRFLRRHRSLILPPLYVVLAGLFLLAAIKVGLVVRAYFRTDSTPPALPTQATPQIPEIALQDHKGVGVTALAVSTDGKLVASGDRNGGLIAQKSDGGGSNFHWPNAHSKAVNAIRFSPKRNTFLSGSTDATWREMDADNRTALRSGSHQSQASIIGVAFSDDGKYPYSVCQDGFYQTGALGRDRQIKMERISGIGSELRCAAFSPNATLCAVVDRPGNVIVWDIEQHKLYFRTNELPAPPQCLALCRDDRHLVTGGKNVLLWDLGKKTEPQQLSWSTAPVNSIVFSPDGRRILAGCDDGSIRLWDLSKRKEIWHSPRKSTAAVTCVAFFPDGKRIVAGRRDGTIRVWDISQL